ncbi:MAG: DUF1016 N-terminal domain-containing protein [Bacteroides sp.]
MFQNHSGIKHREVQLLITDLRKIIEQARAQLAAAANCELTMMYWHIGQRINSDVLDNERAAYGEQIVATVSRQLWCTRNCFLYYPYVSNIVENHFVERNNH